MECARLVNGEKFFLEALSFDSSKKEESFRFKRAMTSLEEAQKLFKPVNCSTPEAVFRSRQTHSVKLQAELQSLMDSTLVEQEKSENKARKLHEENKDLQKMLEEANEAKHAAQRFEIASQCCICKNAMVSLAFMPCQHACSCDTCWRTYAKKFANSPPTCPLCRKPTEGWMNIHLN